MDSVESAVELWRKNVKLSFDKSFAPIQSRDSCFSGKVYANIVAKKFVLTDIPSYCQFEIKTNLSRWLRFVKPSFCVAPDFANIKVT